MAKPFRADNIGSLLRPAELLEARAALREGRMDERRVREIEDRSILKALEMQKATGVDVVAVGAVFDVDIEDPFEQPGPTHARRRALDVSVLA